MIAVRSLLRSLGRDRGAGRNSRRLREPRQMPGQGLIPDEATIGRLRRFSLNHTLRPVDGLVGEHRSRRRGAAAEFSDSIPYTPGDDIRRIDWNAYARFETLYVRESEITTELNLHLLVDTSASMDWSGADDRDTKLRMARRIGTLLAWIALSRSDRVSVTGVAGGPVEAFGPVQGRGMVVAVAERLASLPGGGATALIEAIEAYAVAHPKPGLLVIVSDLIGVDAEALDRALARLANGRWRVAILHVEDPLEADPAALAAPHAVLEIEDPETGMRQRINMHEDTVRRYVRGRNTWLESLTTTARRRSVSLIRLSTGMRLDPDVLMRLEREGVIVA
jgi:uncharacterized protein (DUF58 family)